MRTTIFIGFALLALGCGDDTTGSGGGGGSTSSSSTTSGSSPTASSGGTPTSSNSSSASTGGDGGAGGAPSTSSNGGGGAGQGGGDPAALIAACEAFLAASDSVSEDIGCPFESSPDACDGIPDAIGGCIAEWTAYFECTAENTTARNCSCETFEGTGGGFDGGEGGFGTGGFGAGGFDEGPQFYCETYELCEAELDAVGACQNQGEGGFGTGGSLPGTGGSFSDDDDG